MVVVVILAGCSIPTPEVVIVRLPVRCFQDNHVLLI